jgi:RloB-like protein
MSKLKNSKEPNLKRKKSFREEKETFLIFCEGENTEPHYFNGFRLKTATVKSLRIKKGNAKLFVNKAIEHKNNNPIKYDQYWIVIDFDNESQETFDEAMRLAKVNDIQIAYSSLSFEYWILCHFEYLTSHLSQKQLELKISKHFEFKYSKNAQIASKIFNLLEKMQVSAINNARKGFESFDSPYANKNNSSTLVFKLVEALNKFL